MKLFIRIFLILCLCPCALSAQPGRGPMDMEQVRMKSDSIMRALKRSSYPLDAKRLLKDFATVRALPYEDENAVIRYLLRSLDLPNKQPAEGRPLFIYLGETHHATPVQIFSILFLQVIRDSFPKNKILLAMEFQEDSLFVEGDPSFRPAPADNIYHLEIDDAVSMGMDVMGLESPYECTLEPGENGKCVCAVIGGQKVILKKQGWWKSLFPFDQNDYVQEFTDCASTPWGMQTRNQHWAKQIRKRQNDYDIIIVHAGAGHLSSRMPYSLPSLLAQPNSVSVALTYNEYGWFENLLLRKAFSSNEYAYDSFSLITHERKKNADHYLVIRPRAGSTPGIKKEFGFDAWVIFPKNLIKAWKFLFDK